jgi:hypothetical protein
MNSLEDNLGARNVTFSKPLSCSFTMKFEFDKSSSLAKEEMQAIEEIGSRIKVVGARYPEMMMSATAF